MMHNLFKMKTEIGQHVLKNPGVAQAIVDKADLKQSDVSSQCCLLNCECVIFFCSALRLMRSKKKLELI